MSKKKKSDELVDKEDAGQQNESPAGKVDVAVEGTDTSEETPASDQEQSQAEKESAESEDWHDRYLRLVAEFDNFRKRSAREFGSLVVSAERELIGDLTAVLDNFERALNADHKGESVGEFAKGVALIRDQLWDVLGRRGLKRMDVVGNPFNPEEHDAMMRMPSDEHDEGVIVQEVAPGYHLGEKVLRHAKVIVSQGKPEPGDVKDGNED